MNTPKFLPAEAFHVGEFIADEMEARGWSSRDLAERMGGEGRQVDIDQLAIEFTLAVAVSENQRGYLGRRTAEGLERARGVSAETGLRLDATWHAWKVGLPS